MKSAASGASRQTRAPAPREFRGRGRSRCGGTAARGRRKAGQRGATLGEEPPRLLARRHDPVIEPRRHADLSDPPPDIVGSARRVRQQHDALPGPDQPLQAIEHPGERRRAVMHDAPEVEDHAVIPRDELAHAADLANGHGTPLPTASDIARKTVAPQQLRQSRLDLVDQLRTAEHQPGIKLHQRSASPDLGVGVARARHPADPDERDRPAGQPIHLAEQFLSSARKAACR